MKMNTKRGPALRIRIKNAADGVGERIIGAGESVMRHVHRFEAGLLIYCLILLAGWCGIRLAEAGLPMDTGWGKKDRDPRFISIARPFRAISPASITALVDDLNVSQ